MKQPTKKQKLAMLDILAQTYADTVSALEYDSVWQLAVAVILSAQCTDKQVNKVTGPLFAAYPDAKSLAQLSAAELTPWISSCGLYKHKAENIVATARIVAEQYDGQLPADKALLTQLPGVGNKSANVILAFGFGIPAMPVDTHVLRVSNRMGLAAAKTPDETERQLCALIPRESWSNAHHWLIWHGRRVCAARAPKCAACPVAMLCPSGGLAGK